MQYGYDADMTQHMPVPLRVFMERDDGDPGFGKTLLDDYRTVLTEKKRLPNGSDQQAHRLQATLQALSAGCDLLDELCGYEDHRDNWWIQEHSNLDGPVALEHRELQAEWKTIAARKVELGVRFSTLLNTIEDLEKDVDRAFTNKGYAPIAGIYHSGVPNEYVYSDATAAYVRTQCDATARYLCTARDTMLMMGMDQPRRENFPREDLHHFAIDILIPHLLTLAHDIKHDIGALPVYQSRTGPAFARVDSTAAASVGNVIDFVAAREKRQR